MDAQIPDPELARFLKQAAQRQQSSLQPRPKRGRRPFDPNQPDSEKFRLIRGQSYGNQSTTIIYVNDVVVLAGGLDPSSGSPTALVPVLNLFSQSYTNGEWIDAVYSPALTAFDGVQWETLKGAGGSSKTLIRGTVYSSVLAGAATLQLNNVELLAGSVDPRMVLGDSTELVTIDNVQKEAFQTGDRVTAAFETDSAVWEVLVVERYRSCRGTWYSGTTTLVVNNIVVLGSGLDPRADTTSATETINVANVVNDKYGSGDEVQADWNSKDGVWEARPKNDHWVAAGTDDTAPATLIEKHYNVGTYDPAADSLIGFEEMSDSGVKKIQGFVAGGATSGTEKKRALRGKWYSGTTTLLVDHIVILDSGTDPRIDPTSATEQISVANIPGDAYHTGDDVYADYDAVGAAWEARPTAAPTRIVRGLVYAAVTADAASFAIDHVQTIGGKSPLTDPSDETEHLTITQTQKESFQPGVPITAIYNEGNGLWEVPSVERFRAIFGFVTGTVATTDATFTIDTIVVLNSGVDPRTDPTDTDETVTVQNFGGDAYTAGDFVYADFDASDGLWLGRPKSGGATKRSALAQATADIPAATDSGGVRTPAVSSDFIIIDGDTTGGSIYNYSLRAISNGSYMPIVEMLEGRMLIENAWC